MRREAISLHCLQIVCERSVGFIVPECGGNISSANLRLSAPIRAPVAVFPLAEVDERTSC